jgi:hypothetical protein
MPVAAWNMLVGLLTVMPLAGWEMTIHPVEITVEAIAAIIRRLFGFVEETINVLFTLRRKTMQSCKPQLFLEFDDALRERLLLGFQRGDFGSICRQLRHQFCNARLVGSIHRSFESEPSRRVNRTIREPQPAT